VIISLHLASELVYVWVRAGKSGRIAIVTGPNYVNFRAITEDLLAHDALRIATREELATTLIDLLQNREAAKAMGERARQVFDQQAGATDRSVMAIRKLLTARATQERAS
jgi:3-deoxy-D-manno-octulosonic-acid transferase